MIFDPEFSGYLHGTSWTSQFNLEDKAYFKFTGKNSRVALTKLFDGNSQLGAYVFQYGVWSMIIDSYAEQHADSADVQDVLSDTFVANTFGAMPVMVRMSGGLWTTPKDDHRLNFLYLYHKGMRGSALSRSGLALRFHLKNTVMQIRLTDLSMATTSEVQDVSPFSLSGVGFKYRVD